MGDATLQFLYREKHKLLKLIWMSLRGEIQLNIRLLLERKCTEVFYSTTQVKKCYWRIGTRTAMHVNAFVALWYSQAN
jgi:hypothetical protein